MIVVADTSPLNYLIQVETVGILEALYGRVLVPREVFQEMMHARARAAVREWATHLPAWVEVRNVDMYPHELISRLDVGEACAIQLAKETNALLLLVDDLQARREASICGLQSTGTLGVLLDAHRAHLLNAYVIFRRLRDETNFYLSAKLEADFLERLAGIDRNQ